ncbi:MAG: FGGY family carbohydrate kinase, partial [Gammaproteobacteria bacterium]
MTADLTLAIDQGSRSTRAAVFDARGTLIALTRQPVSLLRRGRNEIEQSPQEILDSVQCVLGDILVHAAVDPARIRHAGLATQRSSVLAWERGSGRALSPVLSWQDTRTAERLQALSTHQAEIRQRTGLRLSAHYGAGKLQWLLEHDAATAAAYRAGTLAMGPLAGYLLQHLVEDGTPVVDHANAARTLLWNLERHDWDDRLLDLFAIPRAVLPACRDIIAEYGITRQGGIPLDAVNGDQTAALYAHGRPDPGSLRVNLGTGAFVLLPTGHQAQREPRLLTGISRSDATTADYFLEGTINGAGAALDWAVERFAAPGWSQRLPA